MNQLIETFEIIEHAQNYPSKYIQLLGYNMDTPAQYFELRFASGQLIKINNAKRYKYSQDAFYVVRTNFNVERR